MKKNKTERTYSNLNTTDIMFNSYCTTSSFSVYKKEKEKIQFAIHNECTPNLDREQVDNELPQNLQKIAPFKKVDEIMKKTYTIGSNVIRIDPIKLNEIVPKLSYQGYRLLTVIIHQIYNNGVIVNDKAGAWDGYVDLSQTNLDENYKEYNFSKKTLYKAINELKELDIIRKMEGKPGFYWYDFSFCSRSSTKAIWMKYFKRMIKLGIIKELQPYIEKMHKLYGKNSKTFKYIYRED